MLCVVVVQFTSIAGGSQMSVEDQLTDGTLGVLLPDEMVQKFGLEDGDIFEVIDTGHGIALKPLNEVISARMGAADPHRKRYSAVVQDLTKL
jgi:hypothetical protein